MKVFIISHDRCNDGLASAYIAQHFNKEHDPEVFFLNHTGDDTYELSKLGFFDRLTEFKDVDSPTLYTTDYSLDPVALTRILEDYPGLCVISIDHHKGAKIELEDAVSSNEYPLINEALDNTRYQFLFNNNHCGSVLSYMYFVHGIMPEKVANDLSNIDVPKWLQYLEDQDIWVWKNGDTAREFLAPFNVGVKTLEKIHSLFPLDDVSKTASTTEAFIDQGKVIRSYYESQLEELDNLVEDISVTINGKVHKGKMVNVTKHFTSEYGNKLSSQEGVDFALLYNVAGPGNVKIGLRSHKDFNCRIIAEHFGGGGHDQACGFPVKSLADFLTIYTAFKEGNVDITV